MDFYSRMSVHYDGLFPPGSAQKQFLSAEAETAGRILDVGAGTGGYALSLAADGRSVVALEIGSMFTRLEARCRGTSVECRQMDMRDIEGIGAESFGLIYCIGNTVVHLADRPEVASFLKSAYNSAAPGGRLVIQIVNYDRILEQGVTQLPVLKSDTGAELIRRYRLGEDVVDFITELKDSDGVWHSETRLLALRKTELESAALEAGWRRLRFYGDFGRAPWDMDSPATILTGEKEV